MKRRILALGLLSLCSLALFAADSHAWGLLDPYNPFAFRNRHNRYVTHITCRPYNAFTPICWGNLVCDGCCPSPCGVASGCMPMNMGMPPFCSPGFGPGPCFSSGFPPAAVASDMRPMPPGYMPPGPSWMPPVPNPAAPNTTMAYPYSGVTQAGYPMYVPQYYPSYYPTYYMPYQAPAYWYGR